MTARANLVIEGTVDFVGFCPEDAGEVVRHFLRSSGGVDRVADGW